MCVPRIIGSFIIGLDVDEPGIGEQILDTANRWGVDFLNLLFLTPLPGTRLWEKMESEGRIVANVFPEDWKYYTLGFPVARYKHLSWVGIVSEYATCLRGFHSYPRIMRRVVGNLWCMHRPISTFTSVVGNLSKRSNVMRLGSDLPPFYVPPTVRGYSP